MTRGHRWNELEIFLSELGFLVCMFLSVYRCLGRHEFGVLVSSTRGFLTAFGVESSTCVFLRATVRSFYTIQQ